MDYSSKQNKSTVKYTEDHDLELHLKITHEIK